MNDGSDHIGPRAGEEPAFSLTSENARVDVVDHNGDELTSENARGLKAREELFVDRYLVTFNAAQAYIQAGFKSSSGRSNAARLLRRPRIARAIQARLAPVMLGDEALARLTLHARFDIRKLFPGRPEIAALPDEVALAIKSVWPTKYGYRIEVYDGQHALALLAKSDGRLKETVKVEHTLEQIMAASNQLERGEDV
jgi:hypothetical protein